MKMTKLRKAARDKPCMVRLPGCDGGGETTVLAHNRLAGTCGIGMKPPDLLGAWACFKCHDGIDYRAGSYMSKTERQLAHAQGVMRTIAALLADGWTFEPPNKC